MKIYHIAILSYSALSAISLLIIAIVFILLEKTNKIKESEDFKAHVWIGVATLMLSATLLMTCADVGYETFVKVLTKRNSALPYVFFFLGTLNLLLSSHLIKQHKQ